MAIYSIFERSADPEPHAVPDRFSWFAALLPPIYALVHGLWREFAGYFVALAALVALSLVIGGEAAFWLYVLLLLFVGFEAGSLRRRSLARKGFAYRAERIAQNEELAAVDWLRRPAQ